MNDTVNPVPQEVVAVEEEGSLDLGEGIQGGNLHLTSLKRCFDSRG